MSEDLIEAVLGHDTQGVEKILKRGNIDVNTCDNYGNTSLILAAMNGYTDIVTILLHHPYVDIRARNVYGQSAYDLCGDESIRRSLVTVSSNTKDFADVCIITVS